MSTHSSSKQSAPSLIVGLTGGIGSGKSTVAELFASRGIELADADIIAREVVLPGSDALVEIAQHFGDSIIDSTGGLDRAALRKIVFADENERLWLEGLLHPLINARLQQQLRGFDSAYGILVSPLLLETRQREMVDRVLVVDVSTETQLQRTLQRDGSDEATLKAIIAAQIDRGDRLQAADDIIDNEVDLQKLEQQVEDLHQMYLQLAKQGKEP